MHISTTFMSTPKTAMRSYRACHRTAYVLRWLICSALVAGGLVERDAPAVLVGAGTFAYLEWSIRRQLKPYLTGERTVTVTMSDDEYRTEGPDRSTARTWSTFTKVRRVGAFWVLRISNAAALGLPLDALDAKQTAEFTEFLKTRSLL